VARKHVECHHKANPSKTNVIYFEGIQKLIMLHVLTLLSG